MGPSETHFLLDGGNVVGAVQNNTVIASYLRGINLISRTAGNTTEYYLFNAHGDVVNLVNPDGAVIKLYDYDAFGNEKSHDPADPNPFRYCGEYWDNETKTYYLRARYYAPNIGRFTQQDTHWNTANMIYGDNPHKINEREDGLGLKTYTYVPQIAAIMQSGNLYAYGINNPMAYVDPSGQVALIDDLAFAAGVVVIAGSLIALIYLGHQTAELLEKAMNSREWKRIEAEIQKAISNSLAAAPGSPDPDDKNSAGKGFSSFSKLKRYLGNPGKGKQWHHIVEQSQINKSGFDATSIHNTKNVVNISESIHRQISGYYSSIQPFTNGLTVRNWLAGQSFETQYAFGIQVLKMYGVIV